MKSENIIHLTERNFQTEALDYDGLVLAEFGAEWCGPCHMVEPILKELAVELSGKIKIGQVDIDSDRGVADRFGIQSIPTFLLFNNGEIVSNRVGAVSKDELLKQINKHIQTQ